VKLAASLTLLLAVIVGGWALVDRSDTIDEARSIHTYSRYDEQKIRDISNEQQFDAIVGVGAAVLLIASIIMFSQSRKTKA
jgi:hypothetical protein